MNRSQLIVVSSAIFLAAMSRVMPHPWNFTPVAAIALFGGAQYDRKWLAFAVPFAALLLSDMVLGIVLPRPYPLSEMFSTYTGFAAVVCIGFLIRGNNQFSSITYASIGSAVVFFLITNCSFLVSSALYPHTLDGLIQGYVAGIPFFRNTLVSDVFYSGLLFGGYALLQRQFPVLRTA